jgi:hypothetical protein
MPEPESTPDDVFDLLARLRRALYRELGVSAKSVRITCTGDEFRRSVGSNPPGFSAVLVAAVPGPFLQRYRPVPPPYSSPPVPVVLPPGRGFSCAPPHSHQDGTQRPLDGWIPAKPSHRARVCRIAGAGDRPDGWVP